MSKVYIVNCTEHNYSTAKKYGELVSVTNGKLPIFKTDTILALLKKSFVNFTNDDYVLVSGPAWVSILAALLVLKRFNEVKFLVFDAKEQSYIVRHLSHEALALNEIN